MTVKEMYQTALELVGLETMPEDSGIIYDNGKEVKKVLAGIDMDTTMLMLASSRATTVWRSTIPPVCRMRAGWSCLAVTTPKS